MLTKHSGSQRNRWGQRRNGSGGGTFKLNRNGIAVESVLLLLLADEGLLLCFGLAFRYPGSRSGRVRAPAIHSVALRGGHRRRTGGFGAGYILFRLQLLH